MGEIDSAALAAAVRDAALPAVPTADSLSHDLGDGGGAAPTTPLVADRLELVRAEGAAAKKIESDAVLWCPGSKSKEHALAHMLHRPASDGDAARTVIAASTLRNHRALLPGAQEPDDGGFMVLLVLEGGKGALSRRRQSCLELLPGAEQRSKAQLHVGSGPESKSRGLSPRPVKAPRRWASSATRCVGRC